MGGAWVVVVVWWVAVLASRCRYALTTRDVERDAAFCRARLGAMFGATAPPPPPWPARAGDVVEFRCSDAPPLCPEEAVRCDVAYERELSCARPRSRRFVACWVTGQRCAAGRCLAESTGCADACADGCDSTVTALPSSWMWPVPASRRVRRHFGVPDSDSSCGLFPGLEIAGPEGAAVVAVERGRVVYVGDLWVKGPAVGRGPHAVVVRHGPKLFSVYSHNRRARTSVGACVDRGSLLAELGGRGFVVGGGTVLRVEILEGTAFTGQWPVPFLSACDHYLNASRLLFG